MSAMNGLTITSKWLQFSRVSQTLLILLVAVFAMRWHLISRLDINWDEFHYLSFIYDNQRGSSVSHWHDFHSHLFGWLVQLRGDEIKQILVARVTLLLLSLASSLLIFRVGRRFMATEGALLAVLSYVSLPIVMTHGASFRPDPLGAFFYVLALNFLLPPARSYITAAIVGIGMAVSLMISIKAIIHVLALIGAIFVVLIFARFTRRHLARYGVFAASFFMTYPSLFYFHRIGHEGSPQVTTGRFLGSVASKTFGLGVFFPRFEVFWGSLQQSPLTWILILLGVCICSRRIFGGDHRQRFESVLLLVLLLPITSIVIYRNAFPYFYVFALPSAVLMVGVSLDALLVHRKSSGSKYLTYLASLLSIAIFSGAVSHYVSNIPDRTIAERQVVSVVHRMFPEPVAYIDRCSMIPSFPKVGFFMSTWGMQNYLENGMPIMAGLIRQHEVRFLLANTPGLVLDMPDELAFRMGYPLIRQDREFLKRNFVHHWGIIYILGKRFVFDKNVRSAEFEIVADGTYTLEAAGSARVDGHAFEDRQLMRLSKGPHRIEALGNLGGAVLRWGDNVYRPQQPPFSQQLFFGL